MIKTKVDTIHGPIEGYLVKDSDFDVGVAAFPDGSGVIIHQLDESRVSIDEEAVDSLIEALRYAKENCKYFRENK